MFGLSIAGKHHERSTRFGEVLEESCMHTTSKSSARTSNKLPLPQGLRFTFSLGSNVDSMSGQVPPATSAHNGFKGYTLKWLGKFIRDRENHIRDKDDRGINWDTRCSFHQSFPQHQRHLLSLLIPDTASLWHPVDLGPRLKM
jgi:hypothetical protein